jgi:hypothetical protein
MYTYAGAADKGEGWIRHLGENDYNHTAGGLSGVSMIPAFRRRGADSYRMRIAVR